MDIPGTPEPEQPDWFKESIVAWYSPYCKQGMTNFDVIESYADDFTKWRIENTGVTSTQKKIVIAAGTELKYNVTYKGFGNSIAEFDIKYTGNAVIRYQYNKEDGTTGIITIDKSGIYHLPASIKAQKNFGFYCNPQTVTEETTIEQLPTSILKDFSGNKHDAYLYGFKGKLNSGVGIYAQDFKNWNYGSAINSNISTKSYNKFHIVKKKADNWFGFTIGIPKNNYYNQTYKLKFNINKKIDDIKFSVVSTDSTSEIVYTNQSLFGTQSANCYYKHVYDNLIVEYKKGKHVQYLSKPLGCGSNFNADIIIQNCIFKTDNQEASDVSWHFNDNADYKFTIINNYFSHHFSLDSNVTFGEVLFINNSYKNDNVFANANVIQFNNIKRQ